MYAALNSKTTTQPQGEFMNSSEIDSLNRRFGIPNHVHFSEGPSAFVIAEINNFHARVTLCLQGAQVLTFQPINQEPVLYVSKSARYVGGKSVRGGIPVCWPWFGPHASDAQKPAHGIARSSMWSIIETVALNDGATRVVLELVPVPEHRALWPHETRVQLHVSVGPSLTVELVTHNESAQPVQISEALHTYFHVSDIESVSVSGLDGCKYVDKVTGGAPAIQQQAITIHGETDRVYLNTAAECVIHDPGLHRRIHVAKTGSRSTVVWNPWTEKALKLGDMGDNGFRSMLCIESANALDDIVSVAPGKEHRLTTIISVERDNDSAL